jgi:hypothetical protein
VLFGISDDGKSKKKTVIPRIIRLFTSVKNTRTTTENYATYGKIILNNKIERNKILKYNYNVQCLNYTERILQASGKAFMASDWMH